MWDADPDEGMLIGGPLSRGAGRKATIFNIAAELSFFPASEFFSRRKLSTSVALCPSQGIGISRGIVLTGSKIVAASET